MVRVNVGGFVFGGVRAELVSGFWIDPILSDVWDDFDSYDDGAITTNTNWTITSYGETVTAEGIATIIASTINPSGKELEIYSHGDGTGGPKKGSMTATTNTLVDNRHLHFKYKWDTKTTGNLDPYSRITIAVGNATDGWTNVEYHAIADDTVGKTGAGICFVVAKGSDVYDVYIAGVPTEVTLTNGLKVMLLSECDQDNTTGLAYIWVDDFRQSTIDVA